MTSLVEQVIDCLGRVENENGVAQEFDINQVAYKNMNRTERGREWKWEDHKSVSI